MGAFYKSAPIKQRGDKHALNAKLLNAYARADDVCNGVQRAHFVKGDGLRWLPVNTPLCNGDALENGERVFFYEVGEIALFN